MTYYIMLQYQLHATVTFCDSPQVLVGLDLFVNGAPWNAKYLIHSVNDAIFDTDPRTDHLGANVVDLHIAC